MIPTSRITITFFAVISMAIGQKTCAGPIIAGYITPTPSEILHDLSHEHPQAPTVGGIRVTYHGYSDYSNNDGYFTLPKEHTADTLRIVVTRMVDYDLLKNTVSEIKLPSQDPAHIAIFKVTKKKTSLELKEQKKDKEHTKKDTEQATPPSDTTATGDAGEQAINQNEAWYFEIEPQELKGGLSPRDIIIECEPGDVYLNTREKHYTEEGPHFILPSTCIYLLKTPAAPELHKTEVFSQNIESTKESDIVENKKTETDSMGNALPDVRRSALQTA